MPETKYRYIKILGAAWLGLGGIASIYVNGTLIPLALGNTPSATDVSDGYWVFFVGGLVIGTIGMVNGLALLRRNSAARPLLLISSVVLLLPSIGLLVPLLVVVPSLWLTLSGDGKEVYTSYIAREN